VHKNWLNTDRVITDLNGATGATYTSLPFGDGGSEDVIESYAGWDFQHFGDMDFDSWDSTYHAQFRNYSQLQARWLSPDPYDGSYDPSNPQSFNRYAYVLNNPLSLTDPFGLMECQDDPCDGSGDGGGGDGGYEGGGYCPPSEASCGGWGDGGWPSGGGGGNGGGEGSPSSSGGKYGPPHLPPNWGPDPGSFGEDLGLPTGPGVPPFTGGGLGDILGLGGAGCEFGACGAGPSSFGPGGPSGGSNPLEVTSTAISFSGIWAVIGGLTGPATTVSYDPKNHLLCGGLGWGVSGGHNFSIGPVVIHAKPGNTSEDVLGGGSWSGGWNITPWWGVQGSTNSSGYTAGYSYGVPGISGAWTYSGCKHVGG
jgi:RHS repeat-associated protein